MKRINFLFNANVHADDFISSEKSFPSEAFNILQLNQGQ